MNIHIIKNAYEISGSTFRGNYIVSKEYEDSGYEGINIVRYFLYDVSKNHRVELLPEKTKYDIIHVKNISIDDKMYLYFTTLSGDNPDKMTVSFNRYNIESKEITYIYSFEDDLSCYFDYKRIIAFVISDSYILFQNEYIRYNLTEDYKDYFEFEQYLYCVKEKKKVKIIDDNLNNNGISKMKRLENNMCLIKTGFNLLKDERYKKLKKNEASYEKISLVNLGQMVSEILVPDGDIVLDTIDQAFYSETFPYVAIKGNFIIYSKVNLETHEEEVVYYNFVDKTTKQCVGKNVYRYEDLAWSYLIGNIPYIRLKTNNGVQFYNLNTFKVDVKFPENNKVENVINDMFVVTYVKHGVFGRKTPMIAVYRYPNRDLIYQEKGEYISSISTDEDNIFILKK